MFVYCALCANSKSAKLNRQFTALFLAAAKPEATILTKLEWLCEAFPKGRVFVRRSHREIRSKFKLDQNSDSHMFLIRVHAPGVYNGRFLLIGVILRLRETAASMLLFPESCRFVFVIKIMVLALLQSPKISQKVVGTQSGSHAINPGVIGSFSNTASEGTSLPTFFSFYISYQVE